MTRTEKALCGLWGLAALLLGLAATDRVLERHNRTHRLPPPLSQYY